MATFLALQLVFHLKVDKLRSARIDDKPQARVGLVRSRSQFLLEYLLDG